MYQLSKSSFGKFDKYSLSNPKLNQHLEFVPSRGGCLLTLTFNDQQILDSYQSPEELDFNNWGKSGLLYPFPNRLKDGCFNWKGKTYQFPINDSHTGNALHGFGMERSLEITEQHIDEHTATIKMQGHYDGSLTYYPWSFTVGLTYQLSSDNSLTVSFHIKSTASVDFPIGIGWHPYFQLDDDINKHLLKLPPLEMVGVDQQMIPTGKKYDYQTFEESKPINATVLDNCFAIKGNNTEASVQLKGSKGQIRYWQETGEEKFNFLQIFTPPYRTSIALEPMSCNVDALNNGEGLIILTPGGEFKASAGVEYLAV